MLGVAVRELDSHVEIGMSKTIAETQATIALLDSHVEICMSKPIGLEQSNMQESIKTRRSYSVKQFSTSERMAQTLLKI